MQELVLKSLVSLFGFTDKTNQYQIKQKQSNLFVNKFNLANGITVTEHTHNKIFLCHS